MIFTRNSPEIVAPAATFPENVNFTVPAVPTVGPVGAHVTPLGSVPHVAETKVVFVGVASVKTKPESVPLVVFVNVSEYSSVSPGLPLSLEDPEVSPVVTSRTVFTSPLLVATAVVSELELGDAVLPGGVAVAVFVKLPPAAAVASIAIVTEPFAGNVAIVTVTFVEDDVTVPHAAPPVAEPHVGVPITVTPVGIGSVTTVPSAESGDVFVTRIE